MSNQKPIRVLIAEDDYVVGKTTEMLLKKMGYIVVGQATNGVKAVEMTQSLRPDVVLMDIKMPVMDGIEATQHIYETRPTPVVALTAYATPEVIERAIAAGMGAYLIKPASTKEIKRAISVTIARFDDMMRLRRLNIELQAEIAERKRAEEAQRESHERFLTVVDGIDADIYAADMDTYEILFMNEHMRDSFGHDLVGKICWDVFRGESGPCAHCTNDELLDADGNPTGVHVWEGQNPITGNWYMNYDRAIKWVDGRLVRLQIATDITEHKRADEALRESEEKYRTILENIEDGYYEVDIAGNFTFFNDSLCRLLGYPADELMGMNNRQYMDDENAKKVYQTFNAVHRTGNPTETLDWEVIRKDGTRRFIETSVSLIRDSTGEPAGFRGVTRDVTKRKRTEEEIKQRNRELAALNAITTAMMQSALDLNEVLQRTADGIVEGLGCNTAFIFLLDEEEGVFKGGAVSTRAKILARMNTLIGSPLLQIKIPARSDFNEAVSNLLDGRPTIKHDFYELVSPLLSKPVCSAMQRLLDSRTFFTMPLLAKGKTVGGIIASTREELSEQDAEKLMTFANQAAVAIENARLYQETQQRALEQETLREAALALTTALDRNRVIERILAQLQRVVPYDSASVQLLREDRMELVGGRGFPNLPDLLGTSFPADGDNPNSEVVRTRAPFIVEDAPAVYEGFRKDPHRQAAGRSWLGVPMLVGEQLVGMIALDKREPGFYTQGHARLAEAFAAQAAVAIENARLFEEEKRRSTQLALINEVGGQAASILDPDRLMQEVTRSIQESFNYYNVALLLLDEEHREVVLRAIAGGFEHVTPGDYRQSIDEGIIGFVARTGNPWLANDTSKDPYYVKGFSEVILTKSELCIPIKLGDEIIGVLDVQSIRLNAFDQADVVAMEAVADRLAMGIQNARLYEEMAGLYDVGLAVTSALELDKTLRTIYEQVNHLMSPDTFYIALYDEARGELRFDIFVEEGEWLPKFTKKLDEGGLTTWIAQSRKPLFIGDFEKESPPVAPGQVGKSETQSWLGFPLLVRDKVVGVISVQSFRPQAFTEGNKRILAAFANQAAIAVENARLYEQVTQHVKALSTLHEISQELTSTLELDQILHAIAENTIKLTGAARSLFLLVDPEARQMVLATGHGYSREHLTEFTFEEFEAGLSGWVRRERKPALVADVQTDARQAGIALQHSKQHGSRSLAIAPLWIKGEVVGTLTAIGTPEAPVFTDETLELVVMLANQAAIAIENAQLYEETRRRSQEVATLNAIVQALNASLDVQDVFQVVATELRRLVEFDRASIALTDQALQNFTVYALVDQLDAPLGAGVTMPLAATAAGQDALAGRLHLTEDLSTELDFPGERLLYDAGLRSRVIAPLMVGERLIGSLNLASTRTAAFSEQVLGLLQQVAGAIAAALENARLFEETEHLKTFNENVVQGIAEAILIEDAQGVFTFANPAAGELLGYTREELIGRHWATIVSEEQVEKVQQELTKRPHEIVSRYEMALLSKEGQVIPVIVSGRPLLEDGKFVGVLSAFTDIRERVRAEREIEERRVYLERVLGAAPDAIVTLDARHRVVEWNPGAEKLFGYSQEETIGQNIDNLVTKPDVFAEAIVFTQVVMNGIEVPPTETIRYRKDGTPVDVILAGSPILVGDEFIGAVVVYTDITTRVRMEETLRALALIDDLTGLYNRRGFITLGQQQLKAADRANRRMVLLFADFDGLKQINDAFGHSEGDRALIKTANVLRETFRESDIIARIGGDEFVVLAIETNGTPAEILTTRFQEKLKASNTKTDHRYKLSLSVGLARYDPERPCSIDELLARADRTMYEKKRGE